MSAATDRIRADAKRRAALMAQAERLIERVCAEQELSDAASDTLSDVLGIIERCPMRQEPNKSP